MHFALLYSKWWQRLIAMWPSWIRMMTTILIFHSTWRNLLPAALRLLPPVWIPSWVLWVALNIASSAKRILKSIQTTPCSIRINHLKKLIVVSRGFSTYIYSLYLQTFHNRQILMAVRALITGGEAGEFEQILAEGLGIVRKQDKARTIVDRERSHLTLLHVNEEPLVNVKVSYSHDSPRRCFFPNQ